MIPKNVSPLQKGQLVTKRRTARRWTKILIAVAIIVVVVLASYAGRVQYTKTTGIILTPSQDFESKEIQYFLQNDPDWASDRIGDSASPLGGAGCLIACVASAICDLGVETTPKEVNAKLTGVDGFQGSELIWYKINEAYDGVDYKYSRVFSRATIERDLKAGLLPIVNVKMHGNGITHWLLIIGAKDGEFLVFDPLNREKQPIALSTHGRVYAYRVLIPSGE